MLPESDTQRTFDGAALPRRLTRPSMAQNRRSTVTFLSPGRTSSSAAPRRRWTEAASVHHARNPICGRHIAIRTQLISQPGFLAWKESERTIRHVRPLPGLQARPPEAVQEEGSCTEKQSLSSPIFAACSCVGARPKLLSASCE
jgi:hypothetical protein